MSERYRLCFGQTGALRFIGHLDLLRVFQRVIRRAGLPAAYSQGFNPHILLSFALPLPLGFEAQRDYADLTLAETLPDGELAERLNRCRPDGLRILSARRLRSGETGAASLAAEAAYRLRVPAGSGLTQERVAEALDALLAERATVVPKKTKSGVREMDIRPDILGLTCADGAPLDLFLRLSAGSQRFLHPNTVVSLILKRLGTDLPEHARDFCRLDLFAPGGAPL